MRKDLILTCIKAVKYGDGKKIIDFYLANGFSNYMNLDGINYEEANNTPNIYYGVNEKGIIRCIESSNSLFPKFKVLNINLDLLNTCIKAEQEDCSDIICFYEDSGMLNINELFGKVNPSLPKGYYYVDNSGIIDYSYDLKGTLITIPKSRKDAKYSGELKDFPKEIVDLMLERQVQQGNKRDIDIFTKRKDSPQEGGGFTWEVTSEGADFWEEVIMKKNFDLFYLFYERYSKQSSINQDKNEIKKVQRPKSLVTKGERRPGIAIRGARSKTRITIGHLSYTKVSCKQTT